jgi:hypothetical protein
MLEIFDQPGTIFSFRKLMRLSFDRLHAVNSPEFFGVNVMKGSNRFEEFGLLSAFANKNIRV